MKKIVYYKKYNESSQPDLQGLINMIEDGFNYHFSDNQLKDMSREEIIEKIKWFSEWLDKSNKNK